MGLPFPTSTILSRIKPMRGLSKSVLERLGVPLEKCWMNLDRYGNTSSASLPISLDEANRVGRLKPGDLIAMMAIGAGMTWGSALMRW